MSPLIVSIVVFVGVSALVAGLAFIMRGDKEQALRYLRIALLNGYVQLDTLLTDPDLKGLAGDPQFEKLKAGQTD